MARFKRRGGRRSIRDLSRSASSREQVGSKAGRYVPQPTAEEIRAQANLGKATNVGDPVPHGAGGKQE